MEGRNVYMAADLTESGYTFLSVLGVGPQSRICAWVGAGSMEGSFFLNCKHEYQEKPSELMLEDNSMKDLLDQGPTIFSRQNELDNSLNRCSEQRCVCVCVCVCVFAFT